jgi:hypothetical protein
MPPINPVHNIAGYSAVATMAIGVMLMVVANLIIGSHSTHYHAVEITGTAILFIGTTSLAIVYYTRRRRV